MGAWVPTEVALSRKDVASMDIVTLHFLEAKAFAW